MKIPLSWLADYLNPLPAVETLTHAMTMAGLEVEAVTTIPDPMAAFSVAHIREAKAHPNADRLRVCQVATRDGVKEIVCGAPNARTGLVTIYAPIGAFVPGLGVRLEQKPVRGVVSNGMLCSGAELQVDSEADGILDLPAHLPVGASFYEAFGRPDPPSDPVIEIEVTPNRPDWLGLVGIARDLAAQGLGVFTPPAIEPAVAAFACPIAIRIEAPDACPRFAGRVLRGVKNGPSPEWLAARLRAAGQNPINALVDITNFLSLELARPLHVYDYDKLQGAIIARFGRAGEHFMALNGKDVAVTPDMCVIADDSGVLGLGGVMGGQSTGVTENTVNVFIESAYFDPLRIAQTGRETGLISDAQYRFARGVDPESLAPGLERATALALSLCGGEASAIAITGDADAPVLARRSAVKFAPGKVAALSGMEVPEAEMKRILSALGFTVKTGKGAWSVSPPAFRRDVEGPADLVEEIVRIHGFERLPATPFRRPSGRPTPAVGPLHNRARILRRLLAARGYFEAVTWSFCSAEEARLFGGGGASLRLANPIAAELDCMRPSAAAHLIRALARSADRGHGGEWLFEIGPVYRSDQDDGQGLAATAIRQIKAERHWRDGAVSSDVFDVKADLMAGLAALGFASDRIEFDQSAPPAWLHPGLGAWLRLDRAPIGWFGEIHPKTLGALGAEGAAVGFELALDALPYHDAAGKARAPAPLYDLMPVRRDFAFILDETVPAAAVTAAVAAAAPDLIVAVNVFDLYRGAEIGAGRRSLALEAILQPVEKTLTDSEIDAVSRRIVASVEAATGGVLRG